MKSGGSSERDAPESPRSAALFPIIFTDLDGTLLDQDTYEWKEAAPALETCKEADIPVVLVSSKTRAEMVRLWRTLGLTAPFVSENGGGIFFPMGGTNWPPGEAVLDGEFWKWSLGPPYKSLVKALKEIREELNWDLRGFSDMDPEEIAALTGLDPDTCRLAAQREFDEPFLLEGERNIAALQEAAGTRGLKVTQGGRFFHLHGKVDKGEAVGKLIIWYGRTYLRLVTIGFGDSPNDFSMLKRVNYPVLVRSDRDFPGIEEDIPGLSITSEPGPRGWNDAVSGILLKLKGGLRKNV
ncbi:MAG: HAD-IIB family hydrolase [Deltaproteobacteria bacterium]|nr:HAD-IIB family hydrolase [Deltaproteobacteria bacterium]